MLPSFLAAVAASLLCCSTLLLAGPPEEPLSATLRVYLPPDAKLTVDGHPTASTSSIRFFVTPPLEDGKDFSYTLRATFTRNDTRWTLEREVNVRAGQETVVSLGLDLSSQRASQPRAGCYVVRSYYYAPVATDLVPTFGSLQENRWRAGRVESFRVAPFSEQDPLIDAGPPSSHTMYSLGVAGE